MSILIDADTRLLVQGITGGQSRFDVQFCLAYGTNIVAGVTPGRGGELVEGVPVFHTVAAAVAAHRPNATVIYVPARGVRDAVLEALDSGIKVIVATAENVPRHDAMQAVAAVRAAGAVMVGFNTNGVISPGKCKVGGIGGAHPDELYRAGKVGVCSRSGGMSAEICASLVRAGMGVSTCISMGGDSIVGMRMVEYLELFQLDPYTAAIVIFGEPGTDHEQRVAEALQRGEITKPVVALVVGEFQEKYPAGVSFGHVAAMIGNSDESASAKRALLRHAGAHVATTLEEIPKLISRYCPDA